MLFVIANLSVATRTHNTCFHFEGSLIKLPILLSYGSRKGEAIKPKVQLTLADGKPKSCMYAPQNLAFYTSTHKVLTGHPLAICLTKLL